MAAPSAAAAAGAAAAALLQRQLLGQGSGEGWSEHQTGDGRKFFHNEDTGVSQWEKPEALLSDSDRLINSQSWKQYRIWDGRIFYHNKETKVSCWSMPPELRKLRGESTGLDDRPLAETNAEKRLAFQEFLKEQGVDASWDWRKVHSLLPKAPPAAQSLSEVLQKQVFAELLSLELRKKEIQARRKARNAAVALERLLEERFAEPDALGTSYQEAAAILVDEEAWLLIKSDVRREEVFQNVMERLEEKHQKARAEQRTERVVQLQRLMAMDPDLKRPRTRWKDACAVLARRDELHEEDPPIEALKVWTTMRDLRLSSQKEPDLKSKVQSQFYRDERRRRDAFVLAMKEHAAAERFTVETSWPQLEEMLQYDQRFNGMREGEGATAMELFDEFIEELEIKGPEAYAGVEPAAPPVIQEPPLKRPRRSRLDAPMQVKQELHAAVKMEKEEDEDETALDALIAASKPVKAETKTEPPPAAPPAPPAPRRQALQPTAKLGAVKAEELVKTELPAVKAEESDTEEDDDPLMGAALKAAKVKDEFD